MTSNHPTIMDDSISSLWDHPAVIAPSNFQFKSLCEWVLNTALGCGHGCLFCYVPSTSATKQKAALSDLGVNDPDAQWGQYVFPRPRDEEKFLASLRAAEATDRSQLKPDGHRCVMFCSTTDPYQTIKNADPKKATRLNKHHREMVRRALELIRDYSTLNVRILTRSPLAKTDFDLMKTFGNRLLFGMSLPTLDNQLARIYEPNAPAPTQRLKTLQEAVEAGIPVYVAVAPTYPECDEADIRSTLTAVEKLKPCTVFHEPINMRAENVARIEAHAKSLRKTLKTEVFATSDTWRDYAIDQLRLVERIAGEVGLGDRLHLWPDKDLTNPKYLETMDDPTGFVHWLNKKWTRVSEWPGDAGL